MEKFALPSDLQESYRRASDEILVNLLPRGKYSEMKRIIRELYDEVLRLQLQRERTYHKGNYLFDLAQWSLLSSRIKRAVPPLRYYVLATVEDMAHYAGTSYRELPAFQMLRFAYFTNEYLLGRLETFVRRRDNEGFPDPDPILAGFLRWMGLTRRDFVKAFASVWPEALRKKYTLERIPGTKERRVFIGGNYNNMVLLRQIAHYVLQKGYQPIVAMDFYVPPHRTYDHTLALLRECSHAVFEISFTDGHLVEIEHGRNAQPPVNQLLVVQHGARYTSMLRTAGFLISDYEKLTKLRRIIQNFLP